MTGGGTLKLPALVATGVGIVLSQCTMVTVLQLTGSGGPMVFVAMAVALLVSLCYASSFAELSLMMPQAGGFARYTEVALGRLPAIVATFSGYVVVTIFGVSAELILVDAVMQHLWPQALPPMGFALAVLVAGAVLNLLGMEVFARLQTLLMVAKVASMALLGLLALWGLGSAVEPAATPPVPASAGTLPFTGLAPLVAASIFAFMGAEYICPMIEQTDRPARSIPRAMFITLLLSAVLYVVFCGGALLRLPAGVLSGSVLPHVALAEAVTGRTGSLLLCVAALSASIGLVSGVLAAVPRLLQGMARDGQALPVFQRTSARFGSPYVGILFLASANAAVLIAFAGRPEAFMLLVLSATACWFVAYIVMHLNVLVLRRRHPDWARPYRSPWFPLPQLFGGLAMLYCLFNLSPDPALTRALYGGAGLVLLAMAAAAALWLKGVLRVRLFERVL